MTKNLGDDRRQLMTHHYRHALIKLLGSNSDEDETVDLGFYKRGRGRL